MLLRMQTMHSEVNRIRILHTVRLLMVSSMISMLNELFLIFGYGKLVPVFKPGLLFGSGAEDSFFRPVQEPVHLLAMSLLRLQHFTNTCDMSSGHTKVYFGLGLHWALGQAVLMVLPPTAMTAAWELTVLVLYPLKLAWPLFMTNRLHLHHNLVKAALGVFLVGMFLHVPATGFVMERAVERGASTAALSAIMHLAGRARHVMTSLLLPMMLFIGDLGLNQLEGEVENASHRNQLQLRFFRWLMHEQRSPLNDISISLSLAQDSVEEFHDLTRPRRQASEVQPGAGDVAPVDTTACSALAGAALESLEISFDGVKRLQRVMHQVRDFGALVLSESGFAREGEIVFDLMDLSGNIGQQFSAVCEQKKQNLHWSEPCVANSLHSFICSFRDSSVDPAADCHIPVTADLLRLKSAISTYLANAIKFSRKRANLHVASSMTLETSTMRAERMAKGGAFGASAVRLLTPQSTTPLAAVTTSSWGQLLSDAELSAQRATQHFVSGRNRELYALWTFAVQDEGRGMSREVQEQLWDPFSMLVPHEGLQNRGGGGLSLIIAKSIVEHHGGTLHVSSEGPGKGTCVVMQVSLPIALETVDSKVEQSHPEQENPEALQWRSSEDTPSQSDGASSAQNSTEDNSASGGVMGVLSDLSAAITGTTGIATQTKQMPDSVHNHSRQPSNDSVSDTGSVVSPAPTSGIRFRLAHSANSSPSVASDHCDSPKAVGTLKRAMSAHSSVMSRQQSGPAVMQHDLSSPGSSLPTPSHALHLTSSDLSVHTEAGVLDQLRELTSPTSAPLSTVSAVPSSMVWSSTMQPADQATGRATPNQHVQAVGASPLAPSSLPDDGRILAPVATGITASSVAGAGTTAPLVTVPSVDVSSAFEDKSMDAARRGRTRSEEALHASRPPLSSRPPRHSSGDAAAAALWTETPHSAATPRRSHTAESCESVPAEAPSGQLLPVNVSSPLPLRILCVDDAKTTRSLFRRLLKRRTKADAIHIAENGQVAVDMVKEHGADFYCFITMDKEMPVMDGYAASRAIRDLGYRRTILGVTGNALLSDIQAFTACGVSRVLTKPVDAPVLQAWAEASRWWEAPAETVQGPQT